ncbi:hypothetical protein LTR85_007439 [Meristemomyces frigidus]|nr:hypothetical protein LTR85_007439 [Meristemomyces frigidus]
MAVVCHICGNNVTASGKYFDGVKGLKSHYASMHAGQYTLEKTFAICKKTPVSAADADRIRDGSHPQQRIPKVAGSKRTSVSSSAGKAALGKQALGLESAENFGGGTLERGGYGGGSDGAQQGYAPSFGDLTTEFVGARRGSSTRLRQEGYAFAPTLTGGNSSPNGPFSRPNTTRGDGSIGRSDHDRLPYGSRNIGSGAMMGQATNMGYQRQTQNFASLGSDSDIMTTDPEGDDHNTTQAFPTNLQTLAAKRKPEHRTLNPASDIDMTEPDDDDNDDSMGYMRRPPPRPSPLTNNDGTIFEPLRTTNNSAQQIFASTTAPQQQSRPVRKSGSRGGSSTSQRSSLSSRSAVGRGAAEAEVDEAGDDPNAKYNPVAGRKRKKRQDGA